MSDSDSQGGCGPVGCAVAIALLFAAIGLIGLAWKFMVWSWS